MKIIYYKMIKIIVNTKVLVKEIIDLVIKYYNFLDFIISKRNVLFISRFWVLLYYFLNIKQKLFKIF